MHLSVNYTFNLVLQRFDLDEVNKKNFFASFVLTRSMAQLSSNWKKLQAKIKADSASNPVSQRDPSSSLQSKPKKRKRPADSQERDLAQQQPKKKPMGGVHSSNTEIENKHGHSPSLGLFTEDHGISAEVLAEAYNLGTKDNSILSASSADKINAGLIEGQEIGKYVALDCEMVGVGPGGHESALARVSVVDFHGKQVYDSFVKPREFVTDWRTQYSGITRKDMRFAREFREVQLQIHTILNNRVLIGHDIKHDLDALELAHPPRDIRDTAKHVPFKKHGHGPKPALRVLAKQVLGADIQIGSHSSLEDARAALLLFRKHKSSFDIDHANKYNAGKEQRPRGPKKARKKNR